jgi:thioredoxin 1
MVVIELNKENFKKEVNLCDKPVIVDFFADWCGPCQMMKPVFSELSEDKDFSEVKFAKINISENEEIADIYLVQGIPTLLVLKKGQEVERLVGFGEKGVLKQKLTNILKDI